MNDFIENNDPNNNFSRPPAMYPVSHYILGRPFINPITLFFCRGKYSSRNYGLGQRCWKMLWMDRNKKN